MLRNPEKIVEGLDYICLTKFLEKSFPDRISGKTIGGQDSEKKRIKTIFSVVSFQTYYKPNNGVS